MLKHALSSRIETVDVLRGIVLLLMLVDHTRFFFSDISNPLSLTDPNVGAYFTRWLTHYCAPVFIFLAGLSAYLSMQGHNDVKKMSRFLVTRGLWFIVADFTIMALAWTFFLVPIQLGVNIFAAIGFSMIFLSLFIRAPLWFITCLSILLMTSHNFFDPLTPVQFGNWDWLWILLHEGGTFSVWNMRSIEVVYPLLPWFGVIGLGYAMGPLFTLPEKTRRPLCCYLGLSLIIAFSVLRYINVYGNPTPWMPQDSVLLTIMSFLNTHKYPPSLSFLLMTLGPALLFLGIITQKHCANKINQCMIVYGRVPFFFYIIHLPLVFLLALITVFLLEGFDAALAYRTNIVAYGHPLSVVYGMTFLIIGILYYPCLWYGQFKAKHKKWYLSYL